MSWFWRIVSRHWLKLVMIVVLLTGTTGIVTSSELRDRLHVAWHDFLAWADLVPADSGDGPTFWCPMHPQIRSNQANAVCPICNMALVELEGDVSGDQHHLVLMPQQVQQAGVAVEAVRLRNLYRAIDTTGRLDYDETRRVGISSWISGRARIEKLHVNFTGQTVRKGDLMAEVYSPELITAQEEYLIALEQISKRQGGVTGSNRFLVTGFAGDLARSARQKLLYQGMKPDQIEELAKAGKVLDLIPVHAPASGTVIERHVQEGQYVKEGDWLFHLADLSHLWLFVDVFEEELGSVTIGTPVDVRVQAFPQERFVGKTAFIDPRVDPKTRTVRIRIDVDNDDGRLLPGMYARAVVRETMPSVLAVPENAVLWSGKRTVVLVRTGRGTFEPREVELGRKWLLEAEPTPDHSDDGDPIANPTISGQRYHEVAAGLYPGEEVVTAGAFLLNAESQFRNVLVKMLPPKEDRITLAEAVGAAVAPRIESVLNAYFELSAALADDRIDDVPDRIRQLRSATQELVATAAREKLEKLHHDAQAFLKVVGTAGGPVADAKDARTRFGRISHQLTRLLVENGGRTLFGRSLFQFECGMAKVGYERWLWRTPQIFNPYMGHRMLQCGKRLEVLEP